MKKKLTAPQSGNNPALGACYETGYESFRAAVLEGAVFHADKARGIAFIVAKGTAAWIRLSQEEGGLKIPAAAIAQPHRQSDPAGRLAILFANMVESRAGAAKKGN